MQEGDQMTIEEKYNIVYQNNKRYYVFDMETSLPLLDNVVPYFFKYKDIEIYDSNWNRIAIKILEAIDKINPKTDEELLSIKYFWPNTPVFSKTKRTNFY